MNLTNRHPRPLLFWSGFLVVLVGIWLAFILRPESLPHGIQSMWSVGNTRILGASSSDLGHGSVSGQIWRGREVFPRTKETRSRLEFKKTATREEAANADSRVDGRAIYRTFWLVVAAIGFLMMIFGLGTSPTSNTQDSHRTDDGPSGGGAIQSPASSLGEDSTAEVPNSPSQTSIPLVPTAFSTKEAPALGQEDRQGATEEIPESVSPTETAKKISSAPAGDEQPAELFMRWTDKGSSGEQSSHELTIGGEKLNEANSVQVFFDLKQGMLLSAKPTVSFSRSDGDK